MSSEDKKNSYSESLKATAITGGSQIFQILIKIVNTKFIAVFLGPKGMGIVGLLQSTMSLVSTISGVGLGSSAVRDIALAVNHDNAEKISKTLITFRRCVWVTGFLGSLLLLIFASYLSRITFGTAEYEYAFQILSVTVLFGQLNAGQVAILQGYRRLKDMAMVALLGSLISLLVSLPFYYFFGEKAIVWVLLILSVFPLIFGSYYSSKIKTLKISLSAAESMEIAKPMFQLGSATMVSGLMSLLSLWLIRVLVQDRLGLPAMGQFQAGWGVTTMYLQLVFQAMSRDYYPRLSGMVDSPPKMIALINEQLHLGLLIATPLLIVAIILAPYFVPLLYSSKFNDAVPQIQWLAYGTVFKVISWPIAFTLLAKRKPVLFFFTETIGALGFYVFSYFLLNDWGLNGIGLAYGLNYLCYAILVFFIVKRLILFALDNFSIQLIFGSFISTSLVFYFSFAYHGGSGLIISLAIGLVAVFIYLRKLNTISGIVNKLWKR